MVPNISMETVELIKTLQPGHCMAFGSAFKVPVQLVMDMPSPAPLSDNSDIVASWYRQNK